MTNESIAETHDSDGYDDLDCHNCRHHRAIELGDLSGFFCMKREIASQPIGYEFMAGECFENRAEYEPDYRALVMLHQRVPGSWVADDWGVKHVATGNHLTKSVQYMATPTESGFVLRLNDRFDEGLTPSFRVILCDASLDQVVMFLHGVTEDDGIADCFNCKHLLHLEHCTEHFYCMRRAHPDPQEGTYTADDLRACWERDTKITLDDDRGLPVGVLTENAA